jgi:hypothetical protein
MQNISYNKGIGGHLLVYKRISGANGTLGLAMDFLLVKCFGYGLHANRITNPC